MTYKYAIHTSSTHYSKSRVWFCILIDKYLYIFSILLLTATGQMQHATVKVVFVCILIDKYIFLFFYKWDQLND